MLLLLLLVWIIHSIEIKYVSKYLNIRKFLYVGMYSVFSKIGENLSSTYIKLNFIRFLVFKQRQQVGLLVYLVMGCHSLPCRLGLHRRQPATISSNWLFVETSADYIIPKLLESLHIDCSQSKHSVGRRFNIFVQ